MSIKVLYTSPKHRPISGYAPEAKPSVTLSPTSLLYGTSRGAQFTIVLTESAKAVIK